MLNIFVLELSRYELSKFVVKFSDCKYCSYGKEIWCKKIVETIQINQILILLKNWHRMNKYHNWPDTRINVSPKNTIPLFLTNIFLSILNMRPT